MSHHSRIPSVPVLLLASGYLATLGLACSTTHIDPPLSSSDAVNENTMDTGMSSQDSSQKIAP